MTGWLLSDAVEEGDQTDGCEEEGDEQGEIDEIHDGPFFRDAARA
jgi:hypothetical protein